MITHPKETIKQIGDNYKKILADPKAVWNSVAGKVTDYVDTNIVNGNAHTRAEFGTHAAVFVGSFFVGGSESKAGEAASKFAESAKGLISKTKGLTYRIIHEETGSTNIFNRMFSRIAENEIPEVDQGITGLSGVGDSFVKTSRTSNLPNLKIGKIYDELNSSPIGRQTLEYMNVNDTKGIISYNWDIPKGLSGRAYGDNSFAIFAKHTQSYSNAARTSIHEVTHLMGVQGSRRAEMFARIRELKHIYPNEKIPTDVLKSEFDFVKDAYSDLPSFGGERFTNIMNIK